MPPRAALPGAASILVGDGMGWDNIHAAQSKVTCPARPTRASSELRASTAQPRPLTRSLRPGAAHPGRSGLPRSSGCSAIWRRRRDRSTPRLVPRPNWFFAFPLPGAFVLELPEPPRALRRYHPDDVHLTLAFL